MEARAQHKYARISPRKVKIVCDLIRGKDTDTAAAILQATPKAGAELLLKVLNSAVANAENNHEMDRANLFVAQTYADPGNTLKRMRQRAHGRGNQILKRTSHITVVVKDKE